MFFKFCSDLVVRVGLVASPALADILERFVEDEHKLNGIVRVVRKRYFQSKTYKKRQLYVYMCKGKLMQNKEVFEKYFKHDFMTLVSDKVPNVRIAMAKVLRHHFMKEISGAFLDDQDINDTIRVLKQDPCDDVREILREVETQTSDEGREVTLESFAQVLNETRMTSRSSELSDTESITSEDESRIEMEIRRHNSEDNIDHGPVLRSLRAARQREFEKEQEEQRMAKAEKKKQRDAKALNDMLDDMTDSVDSKKSLKSINSTDIEVEATSNTDASEDAKEEKKEE